MRVQFISTSVATRAAKRLKRDLEISEALSRECAAFVLGYADWHELLAMLRKAEASPLDEKLTATALAERRRYQLARLVEFWSGRPGCPADMPALLERWQPSAARPQEAVKAPAPKPSADSAFDWRELLLMFHHGKVPRELEARFLAQLRQEPDPRLRRLAQAAAFEKLSNGLQAELPLARRILEELAPAGDPMVCFNLAMALVQGHGGAADPRRAVDLFQRVADSPAADTDLRSRARAMIGHGLNLGQGRSADPRKAQAAWEQAAAEGHVESAFNAALQLLRPYGPGNEPDLATAQKAAALYRQAAKAGHVHAATNLGLLIFGHHDREEYFGEAMAWLQVAHSKGDRNATQFIAAVEAQTDKVLRDLDAGRIPEHQLRAVQEDMVTLMMGGRPRGR